MGRRGNREGSIYFAEKTQRWCGAVSLDDGKRKVVYGKSRQEIAKKLTSVLRQKDLGIPFADERQTLGSWLDYWLGLVKAEREPTTYALYESIVRRWVKPYLG